MSNTVSMRACPTCRVVVDGDAARHTCRPVPGTMGLSSSFSPVRELWIRIMAGGRSVPGVEQFMRQTREPLARLARRHGLQQRRELGPMRAAGEREAQAVCTARRRFCRWRPSRRRRSPANRCRSPRQRTLRRKSSRRPALRTTCSSSAAKRRQLAEHDVRPAPRVFGQHDVWQHGFDERTAPRAHPLPQARRDASHARAFSGDRRCTPSFCHIVELLLVEPRRSAAEMRRDRRPRAISSSDRKPCSDVECPSRNR